MTSAELSPALVLILGALAVPLLRGRLRAAWMLALPVLAALTLAALPAGGSGTLGLFGMTLTTLRVDALSLPFAAIFLVGALLTVLYQLHLRDAVQNVATLVYAGAAVGGVLAGDLVTLFVYWEITALASVFLIFASGTERAVAAGLRYLVLQVTSGVLLLAGAILHYADSGTIAFSAFDPATPAGLLIFLAIGIKCAFPLFHSWLSEAYPEATPTGAVVLSIFTTKLAIYALARGFAGTEILVPIGGAMALAFAAHALLSNDLRRLLAYSLIGQLGFMVAGIGIGTALSINGAVAHAMCSVLYHSLLFMTVGAVLHRTGTAEASELGGLARTMPWTAGCCIVGAAAIAALPLTGGFVSKSMIVSAALEGGRFWIWAALLAAGVAAVLHSAIKLPYAMFFGTPSRHAPAEAPGGMRAAMAAAAVLTVAIGLAPAVFYRALPFEEAYEPYTLEHVVTQFQLVVFAVLALVLLVRAGAYPSESRARLADIDRVYRRAVRPVVWMIATAVRSTRGAIVGGLFGSWSALMRGLYRHHGPGGALARAWPTGSMAFWATVMLAAYLLLYYL